MTIGGWVTMVLALAVVWTAVIWCFWKVLQTPQDEKAPPGLGA